MLGCHPSKFIKLPIEERQEILQRHLVKKDSYVDEDDAYNEEIAQGVLLRQDNCMGDDEASKQIAQEAQEIYYRENTFTVKSHKLRAFSRDSLAYGKLMAIELHVRRIIVRVDLEHIYNIAEVTFALADGWVVQDLKKLYEFTNAESIGIEVRGGGALNGSDLRTQLKIKEMSGIVKELIMLFGDKLAIRKMRRDDDGWWVTHDMRLYWNKLTSMAESKLLAGEEAFEELMQVQIEVWTRKTPLIVTPNDYWESLL